MSVIRTTRGDLPLTDLERTVTLEERPTSLVLHIEYRLRADEEHDGELVRRDAFKRAAPRELPDADGLVIIDRAGAHVAVPHADLVRSVIVTGQDSPIETTVIEEWTHGGVVAKRSPWVIAWQAGSVAESVIAGLG